MMSNLTEALSHITLLIKEGKYEKDIEEPTPLEEKCKLVTEVKELFLADLSNCGISSITANLAWDITEDVIGADEALNKGFLYQVLTYIEMFENFYIKRRENLPRLEKYEILKSESHLHIPLNEVS